MLSNYQKSLEVVDAPQEIVYTTKQVMKLLVNYWELWSLLEPKSNATDRGIHFLVGYSSKQPRDGKSSARRREEILCSLLDLEEGIERMPVRMREAVVEHYIKDTKDIDSETERRYMYRAAQRLAKIMNDRANQRHER